jgi:hypothetical protein
MVNMTQSSCLVPLLARELLRPSGDMMLPRTSLPFLVVFRGVEDFFAFDSENGAIRRARNKK